jgi:nucleoside-diphosphate-sugar epimerase
VLRFVEACDGIVHLAAVSRVAWGERDPSLCLATNVEGTHNLVRAALNARRRPWLLLASSREVYGEPTSLPVREDAELSPVNVYGASKVAAENAVVAARQSGLVAAIVRLSNVYGAGHDHPDRVIPAFARAAAMRGVIRIDGPSRIFDFLHLDDAVAGITAMVRRLDSGDRALPTIHLVSGRGTTLHQVARIAVDASGNSPLMLVTAERRYEVSQFIGNPSLARAVLGWRATRTLEDGVRQLVDDFARDKRFAHPETERRFA